MFPDSMRASDADRQRVVDALQVQTGEGRLTLAEFEQRSTQAYAATTLGELRTLVTDLPVDVLPLAGVNGAGTVRPLPSVGGGYRGRPAVRPARAIQLAAGVFAVMMLATVVGSIALHTFFFPFPLLIFGFILLRGIGRGPGYHQR